MLSDPLDKPSLTCAVTRLRLDLTRALVRSGEWTESNGWLAFALLLAVYLFAVLGYSLTAPLWHDELFTYFIAQAASLHQLFDEIRSIDLNPPLSYLLTRASFHLFGVGTLQCRLPEIAGFALALGGVFAFVRRRAGSAYGLFAAALLLGSDAAVLTLQARPYGLMLGFGALALAAWQASCRAEPQGRPAWRADILLFAATSALLLTHVFGLLIWAAIVAGELAQAGERRSVSWSRAVALLLPLAATVTYLPLVRNHQQSAFPAAFQPHFSDIFVFYILHIDFELVSLWLAALLIALVAGRSWLRGSARFSLTFPEWVATTGFVVIPLLLILRLMAGHGAFFGRYGLAGCIGISVLFAVFFGWWAGGRAGAGVVAVLLAVLISGRLPDAVGAIAGGHIFRHTEPAIASAGLEALTDPALPLVDASGLTFLEMQRRESSALLNRTFYLTGGATAIQYAHATIFEGMAEEIRVLQLQGHTQPYAQFVRQHERFYVLGTYDYPEDWLLRKLHADGAQLRLIGHIGGSYKDHELYEITLPRAAGQP